MALIPAALIAAWLGAAPAQAADAAQAPSAGEPIAVLGFELVDEQPDPGRAESLAPRLAAIQGQLEAGLRERGLYRVVDTAPARELIDAVRQRHLFVYRCNGCLDEVAQRLGVRLVAVGWVQRVSELILNINVLVKDAGTDAEVLVKSVDLRGSTDQTWARGMAFMLRDWAERRALNPRYGM